MAKSRLVVFDDGQGCFTPLCDLRAIFDQRTAACTTLERLERVLGLHAEVLVTPEELAEVTRHRHPDVTVNATPATWAADDEVWLINGRWLGLAEREAVLSLAAGHKLVDREQTLVAAKIRWSSEEQQTLSAAALHARAAKLPAVQLDASLLIARPWHILDALPALVMDDLLASPLPQVDELHGQLSGIALVTPLDQPAYALHVAASARVSPGVVVDVTQGPVVIDEKAVVLPCAVLEGPCYVGRETTLAAHASLRPNACIGPHCKIGGEVSASIIQGYSNKAHLGYLGQSLVGEWCNLGANTNVSNLKNTYGSVRVTLEPEDPRHKGYDPQTEDTGRMFQGPILGDFVRTGIGTHILTGYVIHTACMIASRPFAPALTQPFGFYTSEGDDVHRLDPLLTTVRRMMARREVQLPAAVENRLRAMHAQWA